MKKVISHDLDIMYVHKPCVIGDSKDSNTPLRRHPISDYPGFFYVTKTGKISNDKLDFLFTNCASGDGYIIGRYILEESEKHENSKDFTNATDLVAFEISTENEDATESMNVANLKGNYLPRNMGEKIIEKISAKGGTVKVTPVNLDQILNNQNHSQSSHGERHPSMFSISGPSVCVDLGVGIEFMNTQNESGYCISRFMAVLKEIEEEKRKTKIKSLKNDKKYGPRYKSYDIVNAFPLSSWPTEASAFLSRRRKSNWPNAVMLKELRNSSCYLVCKGVPSVESCDKMFRLSFSEAELLLSRWVPDKLRVYYRWSKLLLKMHLSSPKILSSYHFKTMFFWFLEAVSEDDFNGAPARYFVEFLKLILDACKRHDIPNYFYPEINMVKNIDQVTINQFVLKLEDVKSHLPNYLRKTIYSDEIEPCGNRQAIYHISQLVFNRNKTVFSLNTTNKTEVEYWNYVFLTLHGHRFSDDEVTELISLLEEVVDNRGEPHREDFVDIISRLTRGQFKSEKEFWKYFMSKEINFPDNIIEVLSTFLINYGKLHPEILSQDLDWLVESEFC